MKLFFSFAFLFAITFNVIGQVPDYVPSDGLVAWYPFNGNANDESGNDIHLNPQGDALLVEDRFLEQSSAFRFTSNDNDSRLLFNENAYSVINNLGEGTISIWIKINEHNITNHYFQNDNVFFVKQTDGSNTELLLALRGGTTKIRAHLSGPLPNSVFESVSELTIGAWHHIVFSWGMGSHKIYIDGVLDAELSSNVTLSNNNNPSYMGVGSLEGLGANTCNSDLDDLGLWDIVLNETEIFDLYNSEYEGCTDYFACNYNPEAIEDDGSCDYTCCPGPGCCNIGMTWNWELGICENSIPTDSNLDGCTDLNDLMDLLGAYGSCGQSEFAACGDLVSHEGYSYSTVQIGDQCWFAENCRYLPSVSPSNLYSNTDPFYYVYGYEGTDVAAAKSTDNYETYGVLYNWPAVMTEGICPSGWKLPSDGDFTQLTDFLGGESVAGYAMKSTSGWNGGGNGSNSSGFTGLAGGYRSSDGFNYVYGFHGYWWSSSESDSYSWRHRLNYNDESVSRYNSPDLDFGFSARCIKD